MAQQLPPSPSAGVASVPVISPATSAHTNRQEDLNLAVQAGRLRWKWPLMMCLLRFPLLFVGFLLVFVVCKVSGQGDAFGLAQRFTQYNLTFPVDLICLGLLVYILRKEGLRLRDLVLFSRNYLVRDILLGIGLFFLTYIVVFGLYIVSDLLVYGTGFFSNPQMLQASLGNSGINPLGLPAHIVMSLLIVPLSAGITEELVYRGYAQPRLQALTGRKWVAILIMASGFGLQHVVFGLANWQMALSGFLATFLTGLLFGGIYLLTRQRLLPLMFIHWQSDFISLGIAPLVLSLFLK